MHVRLYTTRKIHPALSFLLYCSILTLLVYWTIKQTRPPPWHYYRRLWKPHYSPDLQPFHHSKCSFLHQQDVGEVEALCLIKETRITSRIPPPPPQYHHALNMPSYIKALLHCQVRGEMMESRETRQLGFLTTLKHGWWECVWWVIEGKWASLVITFVWIWIWYTTINRANTCSLWPPRSKRGSKE